MKINTLRPGSRFVNINRLGIKDWSNSKKTYPILEEFQIPASYLVINGRSSQSPDHFFQLNVQVLIFIVFELALNLNQNHSKKGVRVYFSDPSNITYPDVLAGNIRSNLFLNDLVRFGVSARTEDVSLWYDLADFLQIYFLEEIEVSSPSQDRIY